MALSTLETLEDEYSVHLTIAPKRPDAVGVVLYLVKYLADGDSGTVTFRDQASVPAELGDDRDEDLRAIDAFIREAREGRVTAFHIGRGGCTEVRNEDGAVFRSWMNCLPFPGRRRLAKRINYAPYA